MAKNYYQLDEKTRITTDMDNFMLQNPSKNKKTGEITWISYKWFSNLRSVKISYAKELPKRYWADIDKIIQKLDELKAKIEDIEKCFNVY